MARAAARGGLAAALLLTWVVAVNSHSGRVTTSGAAPPAHRALMHAPCGDSCTGTGVVCRSGQCYCSHAANSSQTVCASQVCHEGTCLAFAPLAPGLTCRADSQCQSHSCRGGRCCAAADPDHTCSDCSDLGSCSGCVAGYFPLLDSGYGCFKWRYSLPLAGSWYLVMLVRVFGQACCTRRARSFLCKNGYSCSFVSAIAGKSLRVAVLLAYPLACHMALAEMSMHNLWAQVAVMGVMMFSLLIATITAPSSQLEYIYNSMQTWGRRRFGERRTCGRCSGCCAGFLTTGAMMLAWPVEIWLPTAAAAMVVAIALPTAWPTNDTTWPALPHIDGTEVIILDSDGSVAEVLERRLSLTSVDINVASVDGDMSDRDREMTGLPEGGELSEATEAGTEPGAGADEAVLSTGGSEADDEETKADIPAMEVAVATVGGLPALTSNEEAKAVVDEDGVADEEAHSEAQHTPTGTTPGFGGGARHRGAGVVSSSRVPPPQPWEDWLILTAKDRTYLKQLLILLLPAVILETSALYSIGTAFVESRRAMTVALVVTVLGVASFYRALLFTTCSVVMYLGLACLCLADGVLLLRWVAMTMSVLYSPRILQVLTSGSTLSYLVIGKGVWIIICSAAIWKLAIPRARQQFANPVVAALVMIVLPLVAVPAFTAAGSICWTVLAVYISAKHAQPRHRSHGLLAGTNASSVGVTHLIPFALGFLVNGFEPFTGTHDDALEPLDSVLGKGSTATAYAVLLVAGFLVVGIGAVLHSNSTLVEHL